MTGTIVLIHGLWVTPRSWEGWVQRYEARGYQVITPTYAGWDGLEVEDLRARPELIADCSITETKDKLAAEIAALDEPPIIMGHSFGGTFTQLMLARGLGRAGVVIDSAPTEGVRVNPVSQVRSLFPALKNPANAHKAVGFTQDEWHYAFTNTISREDSDAAWGEVRDPRARPLGLVVRPDRQLQARPPGDLGRLRQRRPGPAAVHRRRRRPHHAGVGEPLERQALRQVRGPHRLPRVPRPLPLDLRRARLGGRRRPRPRLGRAELQHRPPLLTALRPAGCEPAGPGRQLTTR